jgi:hypothetical protein
LTSCPISAQRRSEKKSARNERAETGNLRRRANLIKAQREPSYPSRVL